MNPFLIFIAATILETCAKALKVLALHAINDEAPLVDRRVIAHTKTIEQGVKLLRMAIAEEK